MKQLPPFPDRYWEKLPETPIVLHPFNPKTRTVAKKYEKKLKARLKNFPGTTFKHRGSTFLGIAGKNDIEIGVFPRNDYWYEIVIFLTNQFKGLGNLDDEYARFNDTYASFPIEIICMRGYTAKLDKKIHQYMQDHPTVLRKYEAVKSANKYSLREYQRQKDRFFRKIVASL